jgi:tellurite resistance protein
MGKLLIPILFMLAASAGIIGLIFPGIIDRFRHKALEYWSKLLELVDHNVSKGLSNQQRMPEKFSKIKSQLLHQAESDCFQESSPPIDMKVLNCRIQWTKLEEDNSIYDAFSIEICGSIHAPDDNCDTTLQISIQDVTDGAPDAKVVQSRLPQWSSPNGPDPSAFSYRASLGRLPHRATTLSDWTSIAEIRFDWLMFPRKGKRQLQFTTSIMSADGNQQFARTQRVFACDNPMFGYIDLQENGERTNILAVALAFAVSAADDKLYDCEIELIKNWARDNILENSASDKDEHKLDKALDKTIAFFRGGNKLDTCKICDEIVAIAPIAQRYDILELCLYVAQSKGSVTAEELTFLKNMAGWLEVDPDRFRIMMEKVLPVDMHEVRDVEAILGITSDMSKERVRKHMNKEYSKWNSRVTNADPDIQTQADQMLTLIAGAKSQYTTDPLAS